MDVLNRTNAASDKQHSTRKKSSPGTKQACKSQEDHNSPLDFSTKKAKLESKIKEVITTRDSKGSPDQEELDSPSSRLRNILSMKFPGTRGEEFVGAVLNLSKASPPNSTTTWSATSSPKSGNELDEDSRSRTSSPLSPSMEQPQQGFIPSPRSAAIPSNGQSHFHQIGSRGSTIPHGLNGVGHYPLSFSPWGNGVFSPNCSPVYTQQAIPTGTGLPASMEASPTSGAIFPGQVASKRTTNGINGAQSQINFGGANPLLAFANGNSTPVTGKNGRATRPFKAYPKDPLSFPSVGLYGIPMGQAPGGNETIFHQQSNQAYAEFRKQMLASSEVGRARRVGQQRNGSGPQGSLSDSSIDGLHSDSFPGLSMDRDDPLQLLESSPEDGLNGKSRSGKSEQQMKDEAYWERRRKNNEAAKRSRDARRAKEDEIAIRAAFLEQENLKLRFELCALKNETAKLRCMLYSS